MRGTYGENEGPAPDEGKEEEVTMLFYRELTAPQLAVNSVSPAYAQDRGPRQLAQPTPSLGLVTFLLLCCAIVRFSGPVAG